MRSLDHTNPFEAYNGSEPYLFVSYAHKDSNLVYPELTYLHEEGYRIWYDEGIDPGNEWPEMIAKALEGCSQFLVFVSPNAVHSQNVRNEINFAINRGKPFLAVHIDETALPTGLELRMGDIQAILKYRMDLQRYRRQLERSLKGSVRSYDSHSVSHGPADHLASSQPEVEHPSLQPKPIIVNECAALMQADRLNDHNAAYALAARIAREGPDVALKDVRFARFGALDVVDPREVDSFHDLHRLLQEYQKQAQRVPLPIAVFSHPGEPNVFCVQQVADTVVPLGIETCIFNLSSFGGTEALNNAFHHVREIGSSGKIPLVFWENFDTTFNNYHYGFIRYFNPILETGSYTDGKASYQIGNAIFAFLSGTASQLNQFNMRSSSAEFCDAGCPLFLGFLKGFIEILGVNPIDAEDRFCVVRRAVWLRHCLRRRTPWLFQEAHDSFTLNIDPGVLNAFLNVGSYIHGFRSMEAIIGMSALTGKSLFAPECLPSSSQLILHVNGQGFQSLLQRTK